MPAAPTVIGKAVAVTERVPALQPGLGKEVRKPPAPAPPPVYAPPPVPPPPPPAIIK